MPLFPDILSMVPASHRHSASAPRRERKEKPTAPAGKRGRPGPSAEEQALLAACRKGERQGQQALYQRYAPRMFAICLRYADDYHQAEDLLQEGFLKVFKALDRFRSEGALEGWMRRIVVNTAIEHHRRKHHLYPLVDVLNTEQEEHDPGVLDQLAVEELLELVNGLSPGYRAVFNLYAVEGYPHKDIADMLGISEGTSKSQLARARVLLQKRIEALEMHGMPTAVGE
jgi:RNA polymerase sigma-70 factor (ECF subfamily)